MTSRSHSKSRRRERRRRRDDQLHRLERLHTAGHLSDRDYQRKRRQLTGEPAPERDDDAEGFGTWLWFRRTLDGAR